MRQNNCCFYCGHKRIKDTHKQRSKGGWFCKSDVFEGSSPARCKQQKCWSGASICQTPNHAPNNAKRELLDWIRAIDVNTTVTTVISPSTTSSYQQSTDSLFPSKTKFSKAERTKLQAGKLCVPFSNQQLKDFFINDLKSKGHKAGKFSVLPVPEGEISFVFCKIKGKKSAIQAFIDSGANCCIMAEGVPQREMDACKL